MSWIVCKVSFYFPIPVNRKFRVNDQELKVGRSRLINVINNLYIYI